MSKRLEEIIRDIEVGDLIVVSTMDSVETSLITDKDEGDKYGNYIMHTNVDTYITITMKEHILTRPKVKSTHRKSLNLVRHLFNFVDDIVIYKKDGTQRNYQIKRIEELYEDWQGNGY